MASVSEPRYWLFWNLSAAVGLAAPGSMVRQGCVAAPSPVARQFEDVHFEICTLLHIFDFL
jgi:hypothetical protein